MIIYLSGKHLLLLSKIPSIESSHAVVENDAILDLVKQSSLTFSDFGHDNGFVVLLRQERFKDHSPNRGHCPEHYSKVPE